MFIKITQISVTLKEVLEPLVN